MTESRCTLGLHEEPKWNAARTHSETQRRRGVGDETGVKRSRRTQLLGGWGERKNSHPRWEIKQQFDEE